MWRVGSKIPINVYDGDRPVCQCQTAVDARNLVAAMNMAPVAVTVCRRLVALDPPSPYFANGGSIEVARKEWFSLFEVAQQVTRDVKYSKDIKLSFLNVFARGGGLWVSDAENEPAARDTTLPPETRCTVYVPSLERKPGCCHNCGLPKYAHVSADHPMRKAWCRYSARGYFNGKRNSSRNSHAA